MKVIRKVISEVVDVNPRTPPDILSDLKRVVDFVPMVQLSEKGYVTPNGSRPMGEVLKGYTYFENGDVLVAKITPCMENGKAAFVHNLPHQIGFGSTEFHVLRPGDSIEGRYLFYMIWNSEFRNEAERHMTGSAGQKRVPKSFFDRFEIPLPPLSEQKRIADILDKADAIRRKRQEFLDVIATSYKSLFVSMFGDPVENHRGYVVKKIADVATRISKGESPKWQGFEYQDSGVQFITSENVRWGYLDTSTPKFIPHAFHAKIERSQLAKDDLLINLVGASVGRAALVPETELPANVNQAVAVISLDRKQVLPSFLLHQLLNDRFQRVLLGNVVESARANISLTNIRETIVLVPDIEKQLAWDKIVRSNARLTDSLHACLGTVCGTLQLPRPTSIQRGVVIHAAWPAQRRSNSPGKSDRLSDARRRGLQQACDQFRSGGFIVLMCIAWTSLFHAIFLRDRKKPFHKTQKGRYIKIDGDFKAWELSHCLDEHFGVPPQRSEITCDSW
ncbi:MAG UNVERIFIED_CONTAM: DUF3644 domain-containing protein [Planctomycetaceae bacterium]|jgi:type I restriction enzyme S subunit